jgi:signal transduction histidine kinase
MSWRSVLGKITEVQSKVGMTSTRRRGRPRPVSIGAHAHASRASALIGTDLRVARARALRSQARRGAVPTPDHLPARTLPAVMPLTWGNTSNKGILSKLACELVTNALRHGEGPVRVRVSYAGGDLRVDVHDDGAGRPVSQLAAADSEAGRGLALLDALIGMHDGKRGVADDRTGRGKTVFAVICLTARPAGDR